MRSLIPLKPKSRKNTMNYRLSITKEEINELPLYEFEGEISLIETEAECLKAINKLKGELLLGFDTETRASFKKGERYDVSLLQLATESHAYLFRLNKVGINSGLIDILSDPKVIKAGVGLRDDIKAIQKLHPFKASNFIDLADTAKELKIENFGLRALTAICLNKRLSKKAKVSNWEKNELTPAQVGYAACDAVVGYKIYECLCGSEKNIEMF